MEQKEIDKLIRCREVVDYFLIWYPHVEESYDTLVVYIEDELKKEGFNTLKEFKDYNRKCNMDEFNRCMPLFGNCDWCGEDELKNQPCFKIFGRTECTLRPKNSGVDKGALDYGYYEYIQKKLVQKGDKFVYHNNPCPDGSGWYFKVSGNKEFSFNVNWDFIRHYPANANWTKQDFERSLMIKQILKEVSNG